MNSIFRKSETAIVVIVFGLYVASDWVADTLVRIV